MTPHPDPLLPFRMPWRGLWTATRYVYVSVGRFVSRTWWLATCSLWAGAIYLTLWYFPLGALIPPLMLWIFALWAALPWLLLQARHPEDIEAPDEAPVSADIDQTCP